MLQPLSYMDLDDEWRLHMCTSCNLITSEMFQLQVGDQLDALNINYNEC